VAYLQPSDAAPIATDLIASMGRALDLAIPDEDLDSLSTALRDQLASIHTIEALDLEGAGPPTRFDPRWHD
jgi:hypothetical protein